jgi:hypothetical protein
MKKRNGIAVAAGTILAVGISLAVVSPANAYAYTAHYGYANCYTQYPTTQSYGIGTVTHQIEDGVSGGYSSMSFSNGATRTIRTYQRPWSGSSLWAAFGYSDLWTQTSWYCS